ncbi:MAG TPA: hypothetical protein VD763_04200 [Candidatus Saccharimonadales bacterium]|nr:hypothetical protein [Candidatus Saccharimonadales bacterium]
MADYAVHTRLGRIDPHRASLPASMTDSLGPAEGLETPAAVERVDLRGRSLGDRIDESLERCRERWAQTVFYLFDPNSWR